MAEAGKYNINGKSIQDMLPVFPEGNNTDIPEYGGLTYLARSSSDSWTTAKDIGDYIQGFLKNDKALDYKTYNPASRPAFRDASPIFECKGNQSTDASGTNKHENGANITGSVWKDAKGLNFKCGNTTTILSADKFPNNVIPTRLIAILQGAGGQGCGGDYNRFGAGGGGGGFIAAIISLDSAKSSSACWTWTVAGGLAYNTKSSDGKGGGTANGTDGPNTTLSLSVSGHANTITASGGKGAFWWDGVRASGGAGGGASISGSDCWPLLTITGGKGGSGNRPAYDTSTHDFINSEGVAQQYVKSSKVSSHPAYQKDFGSWAGGATQNMWGAGGGASAMGPGGHGSYKDDDSQPPSGSNDPPRTGLKQGRFPKEPSAPNAVKGFGGGGGGGCYDNWGGGSAAGYIAFYF